MSVQTRSILSLYLKDISAFPLVTAEKEKELGRRIRNGDPEALQRLAESHLRFVVKVALRYRRKGISLLDLIHEGNVGLLEAARRFDPERNVRFISYAVWWIRQSIQTALLHLGRPIRLPSRVGNTLSEVGAAFAARVNESNRKPSTNEVAEDVGITQTRLTFLLEAGGTAISISQPENEEGLKFLEDQLEQTLIPSQDLELQRRIEEASLASALRALERREEEILSLRYGLEGRKPHTLRQIGDRLGLSRERIRQIESKAIQRLRQNWRPIPLQAL